MLIPWQENVTRIPTPSPWSFNHYESIQPNMLPTAHLKLYQSVAAQSSIGSAAKNSTPEREPQFPWSRLLMMVDVVATTLQKWCIIDSHLNCSPDHCKQIHVRERCHKLHTVVCAQHNIVEWPWLPLWPQNPLHCVNWQSCTIESFTCGNVWG